MIYFHFKLLQIIKAQKLFVFKVLIQKEEWSEADTGITLKIKCSIQLL